MDMDASWTTSRLQIDEGQEQTSSSCSQHQQVATPADPPLLPSASPAAIPPTIASPCDPGTQAEDASTMGVIRKKTATRGGEGGVKYVCDVCSADITSTVGALLPLPLTLLPLLERVM